MKKPPAVVAAESFAKYKGEELATAQALVKRLAGEHSAALEAVREAQLEADSALPQCSVVKASWRTGKELSEWRVVILRKTTSGRLVVRKVGDAASVEMRDEVQAERGALHPGQEVQLSGRLAASPGRA